MAETTATPLTAAPASLAQRVQEKVSSYAALTTAILAALAAIAGLLSARHGGIATSELVRSSDVWNQYQAKSLKSYILSSEGKILTALGKAQGEKEKAKLDELDHDKETLKAEATACEANCKKHGGLGRVLGNAIMLFQIAIANAAISALTKRAGFWFVAASFGLAGLGFLIYYFTL